MPVVTELYTVLKVCPKIGLSLAMPLHSIGIENHEHGTQMGIQSSGVTQRIFTYFSIISTVFIIMFCICMTAVYH